MAPNTSDCASGTTRELPDRNMSQLVTALGWEVSLFLGALLLSVVHKLLAGTIKTQGLLNDKLADGGLSPARVQLLVLTLSASGYYLIQVAHDPTKLPTPPLELLGVVGGSNLVYLGAKLRSAIEHRTQSGG